MTKKDTSKPIITKQMLIDAKACPEQVELFEEIFGDSVVVTLKRAEKVAHLFDWEWAIRLLDATAQPEYMRATADAFAKYERAIVAARAELARTLDRAKEAARDEYRRVGAPAWATAFIDMHKRGASK